MGLFSYVTPSYKELGPEFLGVRCQTKGLASALDSYWISPVGELFHANYSGTSDWEDASTTLKNNEPFSFGRLVPNGNRGKLSPHFFSGEVVIYPERVDQKIAWKDWPQAHLLFLNGKLHKFRISTPDKERQGEQSPRNWRP
ncbi:hypothetical protein SCBWM1_gp166 [Synechococcus phage S-CBWM1]|uniref:Uncharacterized protein n=1 Tax=Synechococcus phage S-CBWM1 TaxID=2053653 RepID=A0A3G1L3Y1_9CAUD|nr:hypothetical protein HOU61_gp031 [Synechococcus phage S-CBWM1]ATW62850.1 hypothetical protein SCBWM1_gp166 [Synechococcus phage S-CBWM1]